MVCFVIVIVATCEHVINSEKMPPAGCKGDLQQSAPLEGDKELQMERKTAGRLV